MSTPSKDHRGGQDPAEDPGQVSEVNRLPDEPSPIQPEDSIAGAPDGESGRPDEGKVGPEAPVNDPRPRLPRYPKKEEIPLVERYRAKFGR